MCFSIGNPTVCVTCVWAGVDSAWEQRKLEARKILENAARPKGSPTRQAVRSDERSEYGVHIIPMFLTGRFVGLRFTGSPLQLTLLC